VRAHRIGGQDRRVAEIEAAQPAARIARGPNRAPGASDVSSSIGAPTIAASAPARSAGSSV
jgi:hypothetical protein